MTGQTGEDEAKAINAYPVMNLPHILEEEKEEKEEDKKKEEKEEKEEKGHRGEVKLELFCWLLRQPWASWPPPQPQWLNDDLPKLISFQIPLNENWFRYWHTI